MADLPLKAHVFVCTNQKPNGECCAAKGGVELRDKLKAMCKMAPFSETVRINASGCLGKCSEGIAAVIYPQGKWMTQLKSTDADSIFKEISRILEDKQS